MKIDLSVGFDAIFNRHTLWVVMNDTREACLNWLMANPDVIKDVMIGMYDHTILIPGQDYVNMHIAG